MERKDYYDLVVGGISIGCESITAGTLGGFIYIDGEPYMISNSHVMADSGISPLGCDILQPGPIDSGDPMESNIIGELELFVPFHPDKPNRIDMALATITAPYKDSIIGLGQSGEMASENNYVADPRLGDMVIKSGRSTSVSIGMISELDATFQIGG